MTELYVNESEVSWAGKTLESEASARACALDEAALRRSDTVVLFGAGQGRIARRVLALGVRRVLVVDPVKAWHARAPGYLPSGAAFIGAAPLLRHALIERADERVALLATPEYMEAFPDQFKATIGLIQECEMHKQVRKNTRSRRYNNAILAGITNLARVAEVPFWTDFGHPLAGRPAVIVAAGPSLDLNRHLIGVARHAGAAVFAVNTSLPIAAAEDRVDVAVVIEAIDSSEVLAPHLDSIDLLALDFATNSAHFDLDVPKALFCPGVEPFTHLAAELGSRPLPYGSSVATAAFALAFWWHASPIVLIGQDLAYTGGRAYASGLGPRSDIRADVQPDHMHLIYPPEHLARFSGAGVAPPPERQVKIELPAWGGQGSAFTTPDLLLFARWFEQAALAARAKGVQVINATEGGARLEGFEEMRLIDAIGTFPECAVEPIRPPRPRFIRNDVRLFRQVIRQHVESIYGAARALDLEAVRARIGNSAFVDCLCAPDVAGLKGDEPDFRARVCDSIVASCAAVLERV